VVNGSDLNQVVTTLEQCAVQSINWATRGGLQFDMAKTEVVLFMCWQGHMKHLWPKPTAKIKGGNGIIWSHKQATRWLGVWMDTHLTFREHHHRCMKKARVADARLLALPKTYGVVPESIRAMQVARGQVVALCRSELWWDPKEGGRQDDFQLLLN